jgi:hypothetical protein
VEVSSKKTSMENDIQTSKRPWQTMDSSKWTLWHVTECARKGRNSSGFCLITANCQNRPHYQNNINYWKPTVWQQIRTLIKLHTIGKNTNTMTVVNYKWEYLHSAISWNRGVYIQMKSGRPCPGLSKNHLGAIVPFYIQNVNPHTKETKWIHQCTQLFKRF